MGSEKEKGKINRRNFLHSAAAAGAGLAFLQGVAGRSASGKEPDDINVALLGAGHQGFVLMNSCRRIPGIRFKAVCDVWPSYYPRLASRMIEGYGHEHNTYADYREMLDNETDLDAVIIATPDFWHAPHTVACLKAGLHVYCETGMANTVEGAKKMVEAAKRTGKLLQIGCQRRSSSLYLHCYEKLLHGHKIFGRMVAASAQWNRMEMAPLGWPERSTLDQATLERYGYESMSQFRNWRWYRGLGGGPVVDYGSHQIDVFNWFLGGAPSAVMASGHTCHLHKENRQWYDTVMVVYEYETDEGPVSASYQILSSNRHNGYFERFMGERGTLEVSENPYRALAFPQIMTLTDESWARCVKERDLVGPDELMNKIDMLTLEQIRHSLSVGESIRFPPHPKVRNLIQGVTWSGSRHVLTVPVEFRMTSHHLHLKNFFDAVRGRAELNCPAEVGYQTTVSVLKINEAVEAGRKLTFKPEEFAV
jgi:predicted dehydrogenase